MTHGTALPLGVAGLKCHVLLFLMTELINGTLAGAHL